MTGFVLVVGIVEYMTGCWGINEYYIVVGTLDIDDCPGN